MFNDVCIASNLLLNRGQAQRILIVDLDVHQGNGNASIMADESRVFVFSMHGAKNYPFRKQASDLDIELANDTGDEEYLQVLTDTLPRLISEFAPDMIFYQSAVDVLATDKLGKLALSQQGCKARDEYVLRQAKSANIPVAIVMGGGYSEDVEDVVEAHCNTFRLAQQLYFGEPLSMIGKGMMCTTSDIHCDTMLLSIQRTLVGGMSDIASALH